MSPTLQTIFILGFSAYSLAHKLPAYIRYAAWCIMNCRTATLGGHVEACPEGHFLRNHYNSCKHRVCPLCAYIQVQKWLFKQKARLLACNHYHLIFTMAHELNDLWRYNPVFMTNIVFQCARDTIFELLKDERYLGALPGVIASLHTWSKTLLLHPHIHCLVTGGGLREGKWVPLKRDYLFPFAVARDLFRGKVLGALLRAYQNGKLVLPPKISPRDFRKLINKLWHKKWNVKVCEKYAHGKGVLTYLARYLRGGPIANSRIAKVENGQVTFNIGREKKELMTLPISEFIDRFIQHIPKPSAIYVRSYGLYASGNKKDLAKCQEVVGVCGQEEPLPNSWQDILESYVAGTGNNQERPWECPICGKRLVVKETIPATRSRRKVKQLIT